MEESGQGDTHATIIDNPELKSNRRSWVERVVAAVLWGAYIYCILPIMELIWDYAGLFFLTGDFTDAGRSYVLLNMIKIAACLMLLVAVAFAVWSFYNYIRFGLIRSGRWKKRQADAEIYQPDPGVALREPDAAKRKREAISA
jgi:poly-beta-1,6-N-acetyl-D-glucosamine biosynthesis protein PgaD